MPSEHRIVRQVEFAATGMAEIMHFSEFMLLPSPDLVLSHLDVATQSAWRK